jgi:hypothetical protein
MVRALLAAVDFSRFRTVVDSRRSRFRITGVIPTDTAESGIEARPV